MIDNCVKKNSFKDVYVKIFQEAPTQKSDSGIIRLLSDSKSPASISCQIDMATPNNSGNYRMELENLCDVKMNHEVIIR